MDNPVLANPPTQHQERLTQLQAELGGQQLTTLLEKLMEHFELSANQAAESAGIDPSAFHKILQGENREFKAEHVDTLLGVLETLGKLTDRAEKTIWQRALHVSVHLHFDQYKSMEYRLRRIVDPRERIKALAEHLRNQYPALAKTYDETRGQFPALVPLADVVARQLLQRWGWIRVPNGYQLDSVWTDGYTLISTDLFPKEISDLGPDLRVISKGWGIYVIHCKPSQPITPPRQSTFSREKVKQEQSLNRQPWEPEMVYVPEGSFLMGTCASRIEALNALYQVDWFDNEGPQARLFLKGYWIGKYPVTNAEYKHFVEATGYERPSHWEHKAIPLGKDDHPVVCVSWSDAIAYCKWLRQVTGKPYRLPSEAEWEKAARGSDGREYPWGNEWDARKCNVCESGPCDTTSVGHYSPRGDSPYDCADMAGNVWEWTRSLYKPYPYQACDGREDMSSREGRVLRGGSFDNNEIQLRAAYRLYDPPMDICFNNGFRCGCGATFPARLN